MKPAFSDQPRILVTGAAGVVGSVLVPALAKAGFEVAVLDRRIDPTHDLVSGEALPTLLEGVSGVIHLAACARVVASERDPAAARRDNVAATRRLVTCMSTLSRPPWVLFSSSREVYGQPERLPASESTPIAPANRYGESKAQAEEQLAHYKVAPTTTVRLTNLYGSTADYPDRVVPMFVSCAVGGQALPVRGPERTVDLLHLQDAVAAMVRIADRQSKGLVLPPVLNLCSGVEIGLGDLARKIVAVAHSRSPITAVPVRSAEVHRFVGDARLAAATLDWRPGTSLEVGLATLIRTATSSTSFASPTGTSL